MKRTLLILLALAASFTVYAQKVSYEHKSFTAQDGTELNYRLLTPPEDARGKKFPLVLFLHGAGERGSDNEKQLVHGSQMFLNPTNRENFPAFVLFPQCPESGYWAYADRLSSFEPDQMPADVPLSSVFATLKELLDTYLAMPQVDKQRIYIMGLSMGAMGTYDMTIRYPEIFAAAIPICGTVNPTRLSAAKEVKFRIFHGDADSVVPVSGSRQAYKALKAAGADVKYTEFPGVTHGSWNPAFTLPDFMSWLFSQKKQ